MSAALQDEPRSRRAAGGAGAERFLAGVYETEAQAARAVTTVVASDAAPLDQVAVLGRVRSTGEDVLGLLHPRSGERAKTWGLRGAAWGTLLGLLAGASGLISVPGADDLGMAGPILDALGCGMAAAIAIAAGAAVAAVLAAVASSVERRSFPSESFGRLRRAVADGRFVVLVRAPASNLASLRQLLRESHSIAIEPPEEPHTG